MQTPEVFIDLPRPHPSQDTIIQESARFNVLACGRRWGKTELLINRLTPALLAGQPVAWFAPNEKYYEEVWRAATRIFQPVTTHSDSQKKRLEVITGGVLDFWTLHNTDDPGRGRKYAVVAIDEAAIVPSHRLERQWTEAIRATLTDYAGSAWIASTPKGATYFKTLYDRGQRQEEGWRSWQLPTTANPHISASEVEIARRELPSLVFAQEFLAQFVTDVGGAFKSPARYDPAALPTSGFREATGCDFAYTSKSGDYTAFLRGRMINNQLFLTDFYREQAEVNQWAERLRLEPDPFAFIGGQEKGIVQLLRTFGISIRTKPATVDKLARAQPVAAAWNRGDVLLPATAPWLDSFLPEVLSFTGDARVDDHDDAVDALAALHHALTAGPKPNDPTTLKRVYGW